MNLYDIDVNGVPMHELHLTEVVFDEEDLYSFVKVQLNELDRTQLAQLDPLYRLGIPRGVPDADKSIYVLHQLTEDGWERMHETWTELGAAADAMVLAAVVNPQYHSRVIRGRRTVLAYDAEGRRLIAG